jgi:hypothetical protein
MSFFKRLFASKKEEPPVKFAESELNKSKKSGCYAKDQNENS